MRRKATFEPVIAERVLHVRHAPRRTVVVSLGTPRPCDIDWECPFSIKGAGFNIVEFGRGVDAFQALTMALEGIRHYLDNSEAELSWTGVLPDHSGFQRLIPLFTGPSMMGRLERLVDREVEREAKRLEQRHRARTRRARRTTIR